MFDQINHREGNGIAKDELLIEIDNELCIRNSCREMNLIAFVHVNMLNFHIRQNVGNMAWMGFPMNFQSPGC